MPPKKADKKKADASDLEGRSGSIGEIRGPVNTCEFKIKIELQHEAGHYLKIKYDWINMV